MVDDVLYIIDIYNHHIYRNCIMFILTLYVNILNIYYIIKLEQKFNCLSVNDCDSLRDGWQPLNNDITCWGDIRYHRLYENNITTRINNEINTV